MARSTLYRRRQPVTPKPKRRPRPHRALDETEREEVLGALHCERFVDKAPAQVWATLLDEGTYLCSIRTMYRILEEHGEVRERRNQRGIPSSSEVFFWISNIVSTRARRRWSRAFSRSSSLTRGSSAFAFRPRFLDVIPTLAISSRWRRQLDNCDEYKPSRRRRAATSPSPLPKASASRTIRSLYSALKRRRFACSTTSGSSTPAASRPAGSVE